MADVATSAIERLVNANAVFLRTGSLLALSGKPSAEAFAEFARQLDSDENLRGGGALAWSVVIPAAEVPRLEAQRRAAGFKDFRVRPAPVGGTVMPIVHVHPDGPGAREAFGFDIWSEPNRRTAIERAIRTGRPTASGMIHLVVSDVHGEHTGFAIYAPAFSGSGPARRLIGVISRGINAQQFVQSALAPERLPDYGLALYDAESPGSAAMVVVGPQGTPDKRIVREVALADHRMRIEISLPAPATLSNLSLLTLLFGMMVAALLLILARLIAQQAAEDGAALAWFEEQASIRNSLTRELNHRVKNTLANVLSIVALTRRRTSSIDDFVGGLIGRIRALSATHDLLTQSDWGTTPIRAVIAAELAPYTQGSEGPVTLRGPHVELAPNDALSLGLAMHELATNAAKYGALSTPGGRAEISWQMLTDKLARIEWTEHGGPPVAAERRRGFGTELIEKIVAHELRNPVDLRFPPEGVRCTLVVPVRTPSAFQMRAMKGEASQT